MSRDAARQLLLTALCSGDPSSRAANLALAASQGQLWEEVPPLARKHAIAPLLYSQLKALGATARVPPGVVQTLRADYHTCAARNTVLYGRLGLLFERFEREHISLIPLKGAYLAETVYRNIAVRPMGDVDILVRKRDLSRVDQVLIDMGLRRTHEVRETLDATHSFGYVGAHSGLAIEVHWNLVDSAVPLQVDTEGLWQRSRPAVLAGVPVSALSPEDLLLHLCVHAAVHTFEMGLRSICDLAWTIDRFAAEMDWPVLRSRACAWGAERCVYAALLFAQELLHSPVPDDLLNALKPADLDMPYIAFAREQLLCGVEQADRALPGASGVVQFWVEGSPSRKLRLLREHLFPARQVMAMVYPVHPDSPRIWLYYPVRLAELVRRHGGLAWDLLSGNRQIQSRAARQNQVNALEHWLVSSR